MAYTKGELKYDSNSGSYYHDEDDKQIEVAEFYLPHSCDNWVIGGIKEARLLLEELTILINAYEDEEDKLLLEKHNI